MPDPAPEADVAETCEPPPEHDHHEWHWLRWKDDLPTMALWEGGRLRFVRGEASGNAALLYRLGWRYVGPALSATEIERLRAEVAELQEIRKVAGAALRCALSPDSDRIAREGFSETALAYLAGYGGDWNAMQAAEKGRARGH